MVVSILLRQWCLSKMDVLLQTAFSVAFAWIRILQFWFDFHLNVFPWGHKWQYVSIDAVKTLHRTGDKQLSDQLQIYKHWNRNYFFITGCKGYYQNGNFQRSLWWKLCLNDNKSISVKVHASVWLQNINNLNLKKIIMYIDFLQILHLCILKCICIGKYRSATSGNE